jgi:heat shock protein HslJ
MPSASEGEVLAQVLDGPTTWAVDSDRLTITKGNSVLVFKARASAATSLRGTHWVMTEYEYESPSGDSGGGGGSVSPGGSSSPLDGPTLDITADGTFTTDGTCAPKRGHLGISGNSLEFTDVSIVSGGANCEDGTTDQEKAFDENFRSGLSVTWGLTGDRLMLTGPHSTLRFVLE